MDHAGHFLAEPLLQEAASRVGRMFGDEGVNLVLGERGENPDVSGGFVVAYVEPELVELVGRGITLVEPYVAALGLAELAAVALGDEGAGEGIGLAAEGTSDEFGTGGDVAPLV